MYARCTECGEIKQIVRSGDGRVPISGSPTKTRKGRPWRHCQDCIDADNERFQREARASQERLIAEARAAGFDVSKLEAKIKARD